MVLAPLEWGETNNDKAKRITSHRATELTEMLTLDLIDPFYAYVWGGGDSFAAILEDCQ